MTKIPDGYVKWDGRAGDIIPDGALYYWEVEGWVLSECIGMACTSVDVGCYVIPLGSDTVTEAEEDKAILPRSVVEEASAIASDFCSHSSINHREALARVLRAALGFEPHQAVLDRLLDLGARAYWVKQ